MAAICKTRDGSMLIHRAGGKHAGEVIEARARTSGRAVASPGCGAETACVHGYCKRADVPVDGRRVPADKGLEDPLTGPRLLKANLRRGPRGAGPAPAREPAGVRRGAAIGWTLLCPAADPPRCIPMARGMDRVFRTVVDRTCSRLDMPAMRTPFRIRRRPEARAQDPAAGRVPGVSGAQLPDLMKDWCGIGPADDRPRLGRCVDANSGLRREELRGVEHAHDGRA
jgi:hypothetical protein